MQYVIHEVEIAEPLQAVALADEDDGAAVLIRMHGRPIAFWMVARRDGAVALTNVAGLAREISRHAGRAIVAEQLRRELTGNAATLTTTDRTVTLAVCTHNRTVYLERLLGSLRHVFGKGNRGFAAVEILVVDNAPKDEATRQLVEVSAKQFPPSTGPTLRYTMEPRVGLDFARNRAVAEATGQWVAFIDDDVELDPAWGDGLKQAWAEHPDAGGVTGLVLPRCLETEAQILFESRGGFSRGYSKLRYHGQTHPKNPMHPCHAGYFGAGANMAFDRSLLQKIGGFDEALDTGAPLPGGGDLDIFYKVVRSGAPLVYEPSMAVRHDHRRDLPGLRRQYGSWGKGFMAFMSKVHATDKPMRGRLRRMRAWWWMDMAKQTVSATIGRHPLPVSMVLTEMVGGLVGSLGEYRRSQRRVAIIRESVELSAAEDAGDVSHPTRQL